MQKYKVVVTIPAIIEVTAETACDANEIVKGILVGHEETKNADVIQSAVHKDRKSTRLNSSHTRPSRMPSSA